MGRDRLALALPLAWHSAGRSVCPGIMSRLDGPQSLPHGGVALEAGAEGQLPQLVAALDALVGLHIRPGVPAVASMPPLYMLARNAVCQIWI